MTVVARVRALWTFPVKSMRGTTVDAADLDAGGLRGDRGWAVVDPSGTTVTAAQEPRLRLVSARLDDAGCLRLDVPDAPPDLTAPDAAPALSQWLGRPLQLARADGAGFVDVAPLHVVSTLAMSDAEHAEQCDTCDVREPRANLVLDLAGDAASERDWVGRNLAVGAATLTVVRHPDHCLGVYAEVATPGQVRVGDEVTLG